MNSVFHANGNGSGSPVVRPKPELTQAQVRTFSYESETLVSFRTADGFELRGAPLRLERHAVVFELYNPAATPQNSEALGRFQITVQERQIYAGHAVVRNVLDVGTKIVCEAALDETSWKEMPVTGGRLAKDDLRQKFGSFLAEWQKSFQVLPEYQLSVSHLQSFLSDLRLWLDQVEAGIRVAPAAQQAQLEIAAVDQLRGPVIASLNSLFEGFEVLCNKIPKEMQAAHRAFGQRLLHPYLLCAPFINRCYTKPLGFAGDYEMMNMIVRNGLEGNSLYARLINSYLLDQAPAHAVRGRVGFLYSKIAAETGRLARLGKRTDIFCIACGPAWEASNFISDHPLADRANFCLLDFNDETLEHTTRKIEAIRRKLHRRTQVKLVKNSVQNLLRAGARAGPKTPEYDVVYCSGLYDYLNDATCKALNTYLYDLLRPGGLLVVGNFAPSTPIQNFMGHFLEWFLIYRDAKEILALAPEQSHPENRAIRSEASGTNFFLEVRKPD